MGFKPVTPLTMHKQLPATLDSVATARHAVLRFARDLDIDLDGLVLAVSEAVANVVVHAYEDEPGVVELSAAASPLEVTVTVRDHGGGLVAADRSGPGAGYGLLIIRRLAQHVELADTRDGVALTMAFRRGGRWSAN